VKRDRREFPQNSPVYKTHHSSALGATGRPVCSVMRLWVEHHLSPNLLRVSNILMRKTERAGVVARQVTHIREVLGSNLGQDMAYPD
jgi:hypothetical protein